MENERCHVTVVGARRRVDLAVPADAAIAEYAVALLDLVGQVEFDDTLPPVWSLALPGSPPFPPETSLQECGVADGATLYLRDVATGEFDEPVVTDLEESVEQVGGDVTEWGRQARAHTTVALGILGLVAGFATLALTGHRDAEVSSAGAGAAFAAFAMTLLAWQAGRQGWSLPPRIRLLMALSAIPLLAVTGACLPPLRTDTGSLLLGLSTGVAIGALAALLAVRHSATLMAMAASGLALVVTACLTAGHASLAEAAAVVAVVVTAVLGAAPRISGYLAILAGPTAGSTGAEPGEDDVVLLVKQGQQLLIAMNVLGSVVAAGCLVVLGTVNQSFAAELAGCLSVALILGAGRLTMAPAVVPLVTAGTTGLAVTVVQAPAHFGAPEWSGSVALLGAAVIAVAVGVGRIFRAFGAKGRASWADALVSFLLVVSAPLAVGVFHVYEPLLRLGRKL
ncbi:type VII secretion integral membrane protein EccD [Streptomyces sp. NPDC093228]|uniref:type VII secretion integral membrane protein EccD n=1 Tax=Streptomyces sp. NPDC093228 TaxID=3155070 RepID=UPI00343C3259